MFSIQGSIVKVGSSEPIAGITVELRRGAQAALAGSATTGSDGQFLLRDVPSGEYRLIASDPTGTYVRTEYLQRHAHGHGVVLTVAGQGLRDLRIGMPHCTQPDCGLQ